MARGAGMGTCNWVRSVNTPNIGSPKRRWDARQTAILLACRVQICREDGVSSGPDHRQGSANRNMPKRGEGRGGEGGEGDGPGARYGEGSEGQIKCYIISCFTHGRTCRRVCGGPDGGRAQGPRDA